MDKNRKGHNVNRCLLCHEAKCTEACQMMDPAKILRSLRFDNKLGASMLMLAENVCETCGSECVTACPVQIPIPDILNDLHESKKTMEEVTDIQNIDVSCEICGIPLENPFLLSSSVVCSNYEMCARAFDMGWAGVAFKTICLMDIHETSPRFSALKEQNGAFYGFKNIEQLSPHTLEEDLNTFTELKKNYPTKVIIASIMGRNEQEWTYLAERVTKAGADAIECNFSCPNMEEKNVGVDVGVDIEAVRRYTAAVRKGTNLPILAKMTPNLADMVPVACAAIEAGANGISAINTVKSITNVNIDTYATSPSVRGLSSVGGYSGIAVKPIALRFIADMGADEKLKEVHISGMGGVETWRDAVEFLLLGAGSIQITTAVMQYGYRIIDDLLSGLRIYMAQRGYTNVSQFIGVAVENVVELDALERDTILYPKFHREKCIGCGRCYISCRDGGHQAIRFDAKNRKPVLIPDNCVGCHLCVLVCPQEAITGSRKRFAMKTEE